MPGTGEPFTLAGGPSWKPLPVLFTTPFSLAGEAAPGLWLLVARAGFLLALAGAFALGRRLGGLAGAVAAVALLLLADVVSLAWRGASEPVLIAAVLWAGERQLAGARRTAFALGVAAALVRPEAVPFVALLRAVAGREEDARGRWLLAGGLALLPLLWIGVPASSGDPLAASSTARNPGPARALERAARGPRAGARRRVAAGAARGRAASPRTRRANARARCRRVARAAGRDGAPATQPTALRDAGRRRCVRIGRRRVRWAPTGAGGMARPR